MYRNHSVLVLLTISVGKGSSIYYLLWHSLMIYTHILIIWITYFMCNPLNVLLLLLCGCCCCLFLLLYVLS